MRSCHKKERGVTMKTFLWYNLFGSIIAMFARMIFLSWKKYPRIVTYSRGEDTVLLVVGMAIGMWCAWLLFVA
jgi:hypothetical protein